MRKFLVLLLLGILPLIARADDAGKNAPEEIQKATDQFMVDVTEKRLTKAFNELTEKYWYDQADLSKIQATLAATFPPELTKAENRLGKGVAKGFECLGVKRLGKSSLKYIYLQKFENSYSAWSFTFYRSENDFKLVSLNFGDSVLDDARSFTVNEPAKEKP